MATVLVETKEIENNTHSMCNNNVESHTLAFPENMLFCSFKIFLGEGRILGLG